MNKKSINSIKKYATLVVILTLTFSLSIIYFAENTRLTSKATESTFSFSFNVKEPAAPSPGGGTTTGGGGGGGGGAVPEKKEEFTLIPNAVKISAKQGETKKASITLKNTGTENLDLILQLIGIDTDIVTFPTGLQEYSLTLLKGQELVIPLTATIPALYKVGAYSGIILARTSRTTKESALFLEVKPAVALLDSSVTILPAYKKISPGGAMYTTFSIKNLGPPRRVDVQLVYGIQDIQGREYDLKREILAVETQTEITRAFLTPYNLQPGTYLLYAKVTYRDSEDITTDTFEITAEELSILDSALLLLLFFLALTLFILFFYNLFHAFIVYPLAHKRHFKAKIKKERKTQPQRQRIIAQLRFLEESHQNGIISDAAYQADKKRLQERLK